MRNGGLGRGGGNLGSDKWLDFGCKLKVNRVFDIESELWGKE